MENNWKEEMYEIITHNETSECHLKLVYLVESLLAEQKKEYDKIIEKIHKNHQIELKKAIDACNRNADIIESLNHHD